MKTTEEPKKLRGKEHKKQVFSFPSQDAMKKQIPQKQQIK